MKKLLKEPLLHFLFLGALIFLAFHLVGKEEEEDYTIVYNSYDLNSLLSKWEMQWNRPPTEEELARLVKQNIKQELFYAEALKMNLDHNDEIIKRRLAQKMEFLANDLVSMQKPTIAELEAYYKENQDHYKSDFAYTFKHVFFSNGNNGEGLERANELIAIKNSNPSYSLDKEGDKGPFPLSFTKSSHREIQRVLGTSFAEELKSLPLNQWSVPIISGFGYHMVYVEKIFKPQAIPFEIIEKDVLNDYNFHRQELLDSALFNDLLEKYNIQLELNKDDFETDVIETVKAIIEK